jgi:hypothetical protein
VLAGKIFNTPRVMFIFFHINGKSHYNLINEIQYYVRGENIISNYNIDITSFKIAGQ